MEKRQPGCRTANVAATNSIGGVALEFGWIYVDVFEDAFQFVQLIFWVDIF